MAERAQQRQQALDQLFKLLEKDVGKGAGRPLPDREIEPLERVSTGLVGPDYVLGGGLPRGRVIELYGSESSGKTTLALRMLAAAQAAGLTVAYLDAEHSFDAAWAALLGVDVATMLYHAPDFGEQALNMVETMAKSGAVQLVVIDSVAALVPLAEQKGDIGDANVGLQARLMSQAMRKLTPVLAQAGCTAIFINQIRMNIGVTYGSPETTSGGRALRFYASVRLETRRIGQVQDAGERVGDTIRLRAVKNKTAPPFRQVELPLYYGVGFDPRRELVDLALEAGMVVRKGSWYYLGDQQVGQGKESVVAFLQAHPEDEDVLRNEVLTTMQGDHRRVRAPDAD